MGPRVYSLLPLLVQFDGFEEVILPEVEEEEEPAKVSTASKSKRRKEIGVQHQDKVCMLCAYHWYV